MLKMKYSVAGICVNNNKIFVARRYHLGEMKNRWEFPGGKVDPGESFECALKREFYEEFKTVIQVGDCISLSKFVHKDVPYTVYAFSIAFSDNTLVLNEEHTTCGWKTFDELAELDFVDSDRAMFMDIFTWVKDNKSKHPEITKDCVPE